MLGVGIFPSLKWPKHNYDRHTQNKGEGLPVIIYIQKKKKHKKTLATIFSFFKKKKKKRKKAFLSSTAHKHITNEH